MSKGIRGPQRCRDYNPFTPRGQIASPVASKGPYKYCQMDMTKVGETAVNNKSLKRKHLLPKNHKDVERKLNLDACILGMAYLMYRSVQALCY